MEKSQRLLTRIKSYDYIETKWVLLYLQTATGTRTATNKGTFVDW